MHVLNEALLKSDEGLGKEVSVLSRIAEIIQISFHIGPEAQISIHAENNHYILK